MQVVAADALPKETIHVTEENIKEEKEEIVKLEQLTLSSSGGAFSMQDASATGLYDICPECGGASLAYEEGCKKCYACGYSEC